MPPEKSLFTREIALESMPPLRNDDAVPRAAARLETRVQFQSGLRFADLLVCLSRDLGAFDPRGSSARILP
jgi:hypothetical protein